MMIPRSVPATSLLLVGILLLTSCEPGETLKFSAWSAVKTGDGYQPGESLFPEMTLAPIKEKENIGVAFCGGGNRAATAALGQLRGLNKIRLLSRFRYISSVSGGTWCAAPYCFLQKPSGAPDGDAWLEKADSDFFGDYVPPENLDPAAIQADVKGSFAHCAQHSHFDLTRIGKLRGDKNWAYVLAGIYLQPLKLFGERRFIAYDRQSVQNVINANQDKGITEKDFLFCAPHRPYLIAGATLAQPWNFDEKNRYYPIQLTPNYVGTAALFPFAGHQPHLGGGYVQTVGYDSILEAASADPSHRGRWIATGELRERRWPLNFLSSPRFSLNDLMATSGAAPTVPAPELSWVVGFPEFQHWAPGLLGHGLPNTYEKVHTDGGGTDDSGIAALVSRRVPRILAFVNSDMKVVDGSQSQMPDEISALFCKSSSDSGRIRWIFQPEEYDALNRQFAEAWRSNQSPIITTNLTTHKNPYFMVESGWKVTVTWVFLGPHADFSTPPASRGLAAYEKGSPIRWYWDLNQQTRELISSKWASQFTHFPYYHTFFESPTGIISLSSAQVNALSQFTTYVVVENQERLLGQFAKASPGASSR